MVQAVEFETSHPTLPGEMRMTYTLADAPGADPTWSASTRTCLPESATDNDLGWHISIAKLARLVETPR